MLEKNIFFRCLLICIFWGFGFYYYNAPESHLPHFHQAITYSNEKRKMESENLINTSTCVIPNENPFNEDVTTYLRHFEVICSKMGGLSFIVKNQTHVSLHINDSLSQTYEDLSCCYSNVTRLDDFQNTISDCVTFTSGVNIEKSVILVKCYNSINALIYEDVHAIMKTEQIPERKKQYWEKSIKKKPFNVIIVGIDSMSKLNLVRMMPNTYKFLEEHNFINLKGYTKVGLNTFPNLMPMLTGRTAKDLEEYCEPTKNPMNSCGLIWDKFNEMQYVTAYAEDSHKMATFNHAKRMGFNEVPTDVYLRPYILATENLPSTEYCNGNKLRGKIIMDAAQDFFFEFAEYPKFGFFWITSINHNYLNVPSNMDGEMELFLNKMFSHKNFNETIFLLVSDHGFRFGDFRYTATGWFEENLPFVYMHLPETFRKQYKKEIEHLMTNVGRLTSHFDLYMTFQDLIAFTNQSYTTKPSSSCPQARSLFQEIKENRTCQDACIPNIYCVCSPNLYLNPNDKLSIDVSKFAVQELNTFLKTNELEECQLYSSPEPISAGISEKYQNEKNESVYRVKVLFNVVPVAKFEANVEVSNQMEFRLLDNVNRANWYADDAACVSEDFQQFCFCKSLTNLVKNAFCIVWPCDLNVDKYV